MGGHSPSGDSGSADAPNVKRSTVTKVRGEGGVVDFIKKGGVTGALVRGVGLALEKNAKKHNLARRKKHIEKYNATVPPSERINMTNEEITSKEGLKTLRETTAYTTDADTPKDNDGPKANSLVQPKVASQMDNTDVKSKLIIADKTSPTAIEMSDAERMLKVKRGRKTKTVLTKDYEEKATLSKKALLA